LNQIPFGENMELNLRKARKLESKIQNYIESMEPRSAVKVRALASSEERANALKSGRTLYLGDLDTRFALIKIRFAIRNLISEANHKLGINSLINHRELLTALLAKNTSGVDTLNSAEVEDLASTKKRSLEGGESRAYGETSVTLTVPVSSEEDANNFKKDASDLKKQLEDVEDTLSQKNLGGTIKLDSDYVSLLQSAGLL
jgi:hypothetical protein